MDSAKPPDNSISVSLRPVSADDEEFLFHVFATSHEQLAFVPLEGEQLLALVRMQFAAQRMDYEHRFPDAAHSIVLRNEIPAGRIWVARLDDQIRLLDIAMLPEHRNAGIGATLLKRLQAEAERSGKPLRHMVAVINSAAIRFYERLGFKAIEDAGTHYLMEWLPKR
jgi:ribosomal protein S18 acetylase RimI-like enzyme